MSKVLTERRLVRNRHRYNQSAIMQTLWFQIFSLFLVLTYDTETLTIKSIFFAFALVLFSLLSNVLIKKLTHGEPYFIMIANMLFSIGVIMIYRIRPHEGERQLIFYILGIIIFFAVYFILKQTKFFWQDKTWFFYGISIGIIFFTIIFGRNLRGATNWVNVFGIQIQPGEMVKVTFPFFLASFYSNQSRYEKIPFHSFIPIFATLVLMGLFVKQNELGTAAVLFAAAICTQVAFDRKKIPIIINIVLACIGLYLAYKLFGHVRTRFDIWMDPWQDAKGKGYQIIQGLYAISSGGLFGSGVGLGTPNVIPFAYSDYIFASIIEEMGIIMGIAVLLLYVILFYRGLKISLSQPNQFYRILALVVSMIFVMQAFVVVGGVLKVIPLTGMTLPFMAYGGSSLLVSFIMLGILEFCSEPVLEKGTE